MKQEKNNIARGRINSFRYAGKGLLLFFRTQPNAFIHLLASLVAVTAGILLKISPGEWMAIVICIGFVFATEMVNTAIEFLTDIVSPEYNEKAGRVKDVAAAAVLFSSLIALAVGLLVFLPKMLS